MVCIQPYCLNSAKVDWELRRETVAMPWYCVSLQSEHPLWLQLGLFTVSEIEAWWHVSNALRMHQRTYSTSGNGKWKRSLHLESGLYCVLKWKMLLRSGLGRDYRVKKGLCCSGFTALLFLSGVRSLTSFNAYTSI